GRNTRKSLPPAGSRGRGRRHHGARRRFQMVLITGATGNVGREVVNLLLAEGVKVAAVSRNPETAMLPSEVRVTKGNPSEPQSIASALGGVEALLLSPRAVDGAVGELVTLAASKGVRRAVVLSALTVQYGGGYQRFADGFRAFEDAFADYVDK